MPKRYEWMKDGMVAAQSLSCKGLAYVLTEDYDTLRSQLEESLLDSAKAHDAKIEIFIELRTLAKNLDQIINEKPTKKKLSELIEQLRSELNVDRRK